MPLSLTLNAGDHLLINGASLRFERRTVLSLENQVDFMYGRQVMPKHRANTRLERLYLLLQEAYTGATAGRPELVGRAIALADEYVVTECPGEAMPFGFGTLVAEIRDWQFWNALKTLRSILDAQEGGPSAPA